MDVTLTLDSNDCRFLVKLMPACPTEDAQKKLRLALIFACAELRAAKDAEIDDSIERMDQPEKPLRYMPPREI
jgi:hypothetical protein